MARNKLQRFVDNQQNHLLLEPDKPLYANLKGRWQQEYFKNNNPITIEIGCGRGEYTVGLAKLFPDHNFIGIDIKGSRLWRGATEAQECSLKNICFLRTQVELLQAHFAEREIDHIWITFPDPRPKLSDELKRLTSPRFLTIYKQLLKPNGTVFFKTDNRELFEYTLTVLAQIGVNIKSKTFDFYNSEYADVVVGLQTTYEQKYLSQGLPIHYLSFTFD